MDEYAWASAVGRVRILEKHLLNKANFSQAAEARNLEGAIGTLKDSSYGSYFGNANDYQEALQRALRDSYDYVERFSPEPEVLDAVRGRYDFHNLKVLAKARFLGLSGTERAQSDLGNYSIDELASLLDSDDQQVEHMNAEAKALSETWSEIRRICAEDEREQTLMAYLIDSVADRCYYEWALATLDRYGYEALTLLLKAEVDLANLKAAVRALRHGIDAEIAAKAFLSGGQVSREALMDAYGLGLTAISRLFASTIWKALAESAKSLVEQGVSLTAWERECDNAFMRYVRVVSKRPLGPEPVIAYIYGKEAEVRNLRIILAAKQSFASTGEIAERLREPYV